MAGFPVDALPGILIAGITAAAAIGIHYRGLAQEKDAFERLAERYGLVGMSPPWWSRERGASGSRNGVAIHVRAYTRGTGKSSHRRHAIAVGGAPVGLTCRAQGLLDDVMEAVGASQSMTGDASLDAATVFHAEPGIVLDAEARAALGEWVVQWGGVVIDGELRHDTRGRLEKVTAQERIDAALRLAPRLNAGVARTPEALARVAAVDPVDAVRITALVVLRGRDPALARTVARGLLTDPSPAIRARAADTLGREGFPVARALLDDPATTTLDRVIALELLAGDPEAEAVALAHLDHPDTDVRVAAIRALGAMGSVAAVEPLHPLSRALLGGALRREAQEAIAAIQARLGSAEGGRVSIAAESAGGELSVAPGVAGSLSTATPQKT